MNLRRISYILIAITAIAISTYPIVYFVTDGDFGILASKSAQLLSDTIWNVMFYTHIGFGGIALLVGWIQFSKKIQRNSIQLHRTIGKVYIVTVLLSAISGFYIALNATGGWSPILGFSTLAILWFTSTLLGYTTVRKGDIIKHQKMMTYSYALCFAAVTLRIWLPTLSFLMDGFIPAYRIVAWLCWIPNLIVAHLLIKQQFKPAISSS